MAKKTIIEIRAWDRNKKEFTTVYTVNDRLFSFNMGNENNIIIRLHNDENKIIPLKSQGDEKMIFNIEKLIPLKTELEKELKITEKKTEHLNEKEIKLKQEKIAMLKRSYYYVDDVIRTLIIYNKLIN